MTTALWARAVKSCRTATAEQIDRFVDAEHARRGLRVFESLPDANTRVVEMLGGALVVIIHDKGTLNEEDMIPARLLVFGKSRSATIKQVGQRWFLSPGSFDNGGVMALEDRDDGIHLTLFDRSGNELRQEHLSTARGIKLKVSSAGG